MTLREYLQSNRITYRAFAARIGVQHPYVVQIAHGKRTPSGRIMLRIERATDGNVTMQELVPDEQPPITTTSSHGVDVASTTPISAIPTEITP